MPSYSAFLGEPMKTLYLMFATCLVGDFSQAASYVVVPGAASAAGNSENNFPFLIRSTESMRYQQVYGASAFPGLQAAGGGWVMRLLFRPDILSHAYYDYIDVQINLSTTSHAPDGLGTNFLENVGADSSTVYSGRLFMDALLGPGD